MTSTNSRVTLYRTRIIIVNIMRYDFYFFVIPFRRDDRNADCCVRNDNIIIIQISVKATTVHAVVLPPRFDHRRSPRCLRRLFELPETGRFKRFQCARVRNTQYTVYRRVYVVARNTVHRPFRSRCTSTLLQWHGFQRLTRYSRMRRQSVRSVITAVLLMRNAFSHFRG